jgi:hypothetical protein
LAVGKICNVNKIFYAIEKSEFPELSSVFDFFLFLHNFRMISFTHICAQEYLDNLKSGKS